MSGALLRLAWALPLVLLIGLAMALMLKRLLRVQSMPIDQQPRMSVAESVRLSDHTRVHLVLLDEHRYLVVESQQNASLHAIADAAAVIGRRTR